MNLLLSSSYHQNFISILPYPLQKHTSLQYKSALLVWHSIYRIIQGYSHSFLFRFTTSQLPNTLSGWYRSTSSIMCSVHISSHLYKQETRMKFVSISTIDYVISLLLPNNLQCGVLCSGTSKKCNVDGNNEEYKYIHT